MLEIRPRASPWGAAVKRRTTHVVDPLPDRVRLIGAPGDLNGRVVEVDGWRHVAGELRIRCRTTDGARVLLPAAWTDLQPNTVTEHTPMAGLVATPAGWRRFAAVLTGVKVRRPPRSRVSVENDGGVHVGSVGADAREGRVVPAVVWETLPPAARAKVTTMLARLFAAAIEEARDE